jgi:hypothetical protein
MTVSLSIAPIERSRNVMGIQMKLPSHRGRGNRRKAKLKAKRRRQRARA